MRNRGTLSALVILLGYAVLLFLMVRPGSQGPGLVTTVTGGAANVIKSATGGGSWSG